MKSAQITQAFGLIVLHASVLKIYLPSSTSKAGVMCKGMGSISSECVSPKVTS